MKNSSGSETACTGAPRGAFGPWMLLALSLLLVLGWNVLQAWRQHQIGIRLIEQQAGVMKQAEATERRLQALLTELVTLSKTDAQAKALVDKYQIRYNQPPSPPVTAPGR